MTTEILEKTHIECHCFHSYPGKSEVQSQRFPIRTQLLWSARPFLFRRYFSKVSAKYFRQRNPAVKILLTFAQLFYMWIYFYSHLIRCNFGERHVSAPPSAPSLTLTDPHGPSEQWQFPSSVLLGHKCSASQHTLDSLPLIRDAGRKNPGEQAKVTLPNWTGPNWQTFPVYFPVLLPPVCSRCLDTHFWHGVLDTLWGTTAPWPLCSRRHVGFVCFCFTFLTVRRWDITSASYDPNMLRQRQRTQ